MLVCNIPGCQQNSAELPVFKVIKISSAIGEWDNDAQCVKDIGIVYDFINAYYVEKWKT